MGFLEEQETNRLRGEIKMKEAAVKAAQIAYEEKLKGEFGEEMFKTLSIPPKRPSKWETFKNNLKKIS